MALLDLLRSRAAAVLTAGGVLAVAGGLTTGLVAAGRSDAGTDSQRAVECAAYPAAAGELAFSSRVLDVAEGAGERLVLVLRRDGTTGPLNATITAVDGLATAGSDYGTVDPSIHFDDGEATLRVVHVPIVQDTEDEPPETLRLTLSDVDCGTLGAITTVEITIADDDLATTFAVGGTVSGLDGSGLVLRNNLVDEVATGNGEFTFGRGLVAGAAYQVDVHTQPVDPLQQCSVTNGSGVVGQAAVTDVRVDCVTTEVTGFLDRSFGSDGVALTPGIRGAVAVAVQPDGAVVTAGDNSLARYLPNGTLDLTFGSGGSVATGLDTAFAGLAMDVAVAPDGSIVVAGVIDDAATKENFAVRKYDRNGLPDNGFGAGGLVTTDFGGGTDRAYAVAVLSDGRILAAGHGADSPLGDSDFAMVRYTPTGEPDPTFGDRGRVLTDVLGAHDFGFALAVQDDGRPVLAGLVADIGGTAEVVGVVRYTTGGIPDETFDQDGILATPFRGTANGIAIDGDGRIVLAGSVNGGFSGTRSDFALIRLDQSGAADLSFDGDGLVTTDFATGDPAASSHDEFARDLVVQDDGAIVTVGTAQNDTGDLALTRHLPDGTLDATFADGGRLTVDFHGRFDSGQDVAVQPTDGRIVAVGTALNGFSVENAVVRLAP